MPNISTFTPRQRTDLLVVHCSATKPDADIGVREIDGWHRQRGFDAVGYHYIIRRDGRIENGRPEGVIGAHARGHNAHSIGVCLVGGIGDDGTPHNNFTRAQFDRLCTLLAELCKRYPGARTLGHRDLSPDLNGDGKITPNEYIKACPSFDVATWWAANRDA